MLSIGRKVTELKKKAQESKSNISDWNRRRKDAKTQKTKEKYRNQIAKENKRIQKIKEETQVVNAKLRNQKTKKNLGKKREEVLLNKIGGIYDHIDSAKRIVNKATGKGRSKKKKRKKGKR